MWSRAAGQRPCCLGPQSECEAPEGLAMCHDRGVFGLPRELVCACAISRVQYRVRREQAVMFGAPDIQSRCVCGMHMVSLSGCVTTA